MTILTPLARTTIITSWLFVGVACASFSLQVASIRIRRESVSAADGCFFAAFFVGALVVTQTTWAMIDEGTGKHQADIANHNIAAVAKVSCVSKTFVSKSDGISLSLLVKCSGRFAAA